MYSPLVKDNAPTLQATQQKQQNLFGDFAAMRTASSPNDPVTLTTQDSSSAYRIPSMNPITNNNSNNNNNNLSQSLFTISPSPNTNTSTSSSVPSSSTKNSNDEINSVLNSLSNPNLNAQHNNNNNMVNNTLSSLPNITSSTASPSQQKYSSSVMNQQPNYGVTNNNNNNNNPNSNIAQPVVRSSSGFLPQQPQSEVVSLLTSFSRKMEENFEKVSMQLLDTQRRVSMLESLVRDISENQKLSAQDRREKAEYLYQKIDQLKQTFASTANSVHSNLQNSSISTNPLLSSLPAYSQPRSALSLQPATSLYNVPYSSNSSSGKPRPDQEELDRQFALKLQEEMNRESSNSGLLPGVDTKSMSLKATPGGLSDNIECPMCLLSVPLSQIDAHVNKHLEDNPNSGVHLYTL